MSVDKLAAGIVAFRPDLDLLLALVRRLQCEADLLFVFINADTDGAISEALSGTRAILIASELNLGVGEALNQITLRACLAGYARVALFDDDSALPEGALEKMSRAMDALERAGKRPAVIGPKIVSPTQDGRAYRPPRYFGAGDEYGNARSVLYVISSGSLLNIAAFRRVGRFRSDFFIDAIDTEWCFRAWAHGYSCWVFDGVAMEHRIGEGVTRATIFGLGFPKQSSMRIFAYVRNQVFSLRLRHLPLWWRALVLAHLVRLSCAYLIDAGDKRSLVRLICRAAQDGWRGRLGVPLGAENAAHLPLIQLGGRARDQ